MFEQCLIFKKQQIIYLSDKKYLSLQSHFKYFNSFYA